MSIAMTVVADATEAANAVVDRVLEINHIVERPRFGVATGGSPTVVYESLARAKREIGVQFDRAMWFGLDEYVGLPAGHPEAYRQVLERSLVMPLGVSRSAVHLPDISAADLDVAAANYERLVTQSPIDLQLLGIGSNGHIGFNEPGSAFDSVTRIVDLAESTRVDNARYFPSLTDVPHRAITQGLSTILRARHIVLLAFGASKAVALQRALQESPTSEIPASCLQFHADVTVFADRDAARLFAANAPKQGAIPRGL